MMQNKLALNKLGPSSKPANDDMLSLKKFVQSLEGKISHKLVYNNYMKQYRNNGCYIDLAKCLPANGYFVELGANDGISQSNTYWLEKERGWKGLLIEADPINAMRLANSNRQAVKIHAACGSSSYEGQFIELKHANLMTIVNSLSNERNVAEHLSAASTVGQTIDGFEISYYMKLVTLTSLLDTVIAPRSIDLLSLDVEGYEYEVLDGLDFSKYDFNYILFESRNPGRILEKLQSHGYFLFSKPTQQDFLVRHGGISQ